ncbi:MAG: DUF4336 domain-containing protein [Erythrobacter sp.]|nr:DUF4336 domain-containing protein [Erythrobacter sp.]
MTDTPRYRPYQPQLEPVAVADNIWTVEGPEIDYRLAGLSLPCPTRMTIIRLSSGALWLHSPVCLTAELKARLDALGPVGAIIAPNSYHTSHTHEWARQYPDAGVFAPSSAFDKIACSRSRALDDPFDAEWLGEIDHHFVDLGSFGESLFFHRASATLIVTDLMQNFEQERIAGPLTRLILALGGATGPKGGPSVEIRLAMLRHRTGVAEAVRTMIAWRPARIVLSHGKCFEGDAGHEIAKAFRWIA